MRLIKTFDRDSDERKPGLKEFLYWWLENPNNKKSFIVDIFLNIIIISSIYFIYLEFSLGGKTPAYVLKYNNALLLIFIFEYLIRFHISTDFLWDAFNPSDGSIFRAIKNKFRWMVKFFSLIDLLSILPAIRYLRVLRTIKILRFLRLLRFFRMLKIFRHIEKYLLLLKGLTENWRIFTSFTVGTIFLVGLFSFGIYFFELNESSKQFSTYTKAFWHSLQLIGLAEDSPTTIGGKFFSSFVTISNIFFISVIISLMTVKMEEIMEKIKSGNFGKIRLKNHIVLCGFTRASEIVIEDLLKEKGNFNNIVMISLNPDPNISGVIYFNGDFSEDKTLKEVNLVNAKTCIVFAEPRNGEDKKTTDLRTVLTVYNIESEYKHVHTISEINYRENAKIIVERVNGDELIYKEIIDANLISTCVRFPSISPLIYELLNSDGKKLQSKRLSDIGLDSGISLKDVKHCCVDREWTLFGLKRGEAKPELAPRNDIVLNANDEIIIIA